MLKKILVVDDDPVLVRLVSSMLDAGGFKVLKAASGRESVRIMVEDRPDLILVDNMMPELDGCETCRLIREISEIPVIMLTGKRKSEEDIVRGLECGADEYLFKPVGNRELLARVRAALRRAEKLSASNLKKRVFFTDEYLNINVTERKILVAGKRLKLTPHEFRLLALLLENADRVVSHRQALEHVWGFAYVDDIDYVRIYISHLRQKLEPEPAAPRYIFTEPGTGYYFCTQN